MLGQTTWLLLLTQPWPKFNSKVGGRSYWLLFGLNVAAGVSPSFHLSLFFRWPLIFQTWFADISCLTAIRLLRSP